MLTGLEQASIQEIQTLSVRCLRQVEDVIHQPETRIKR